MERCSNSGGKRQTRERARRKKIKVCEKVEKRRNAAFAHVFLMFCGSGGLKSKLAKAAGAEPWEIKNCPPLWREAHFEVKMLKTPHAQSLLQKSTRLWHDAHVEAKMLKSPHCRSTFGSWVVEKAQTTLARSTFRSQNAQSNAGPEHFWQLSCSNNARVVALHISKSKCQNHTTFGHMCGRFEQDLKRCVSCGRRSTRDISIRHVRDIQWIPLGKFKS